MTALYLKDEFGYKCFNKDLTNRYGKLFEVGKKYIVDNEIIYGNDGNGFHWCKNVEDGFRYFDTKNFNIAVCETLASGDTIENFDEYNGYYLYVSREIEILNELSKDQLITLADTINEERFIRFARDYPLNTEELNYFIDKYKNNYRVLYHLYHYYEPNDKLIKYLKME